MQLSVVIPAWSGTPELAEMALALCKQVRPMCDELIVTEDAGVYYPELQQIADLYLMHPNLLDIANSILGVRVAQGEYIAVINSDIIMLSGDLRDLCVPGTVVSCGNYGFQGCFHVVPRSVINEFGYLNPEKQGSGADYHYAEVIRDVYRGSDLVTYQHLAGRSYSEKRRQWEEYERSLK